MQNEEMSDKQKVQTSAVICIISMALMILAQIPTPEYLNPLGCMFALVWIASGIYTVIGAIFIWG